MTVVADLLFELAYKRESVSWQPPKPVERKAILQQARDVAHKKVQQTVEVSPPPEVVFSVH